MGTRSTIKSILANYRTGKIPETVAMDAIEFVVNRPKQKKLDLAPSRAAVAEELICIIQGFAGECPECTDPRSNKKV